MRQADAAGNFEGYAKAVLGTQDFLGVPAAQQHVLTRGQAITLAGQIMASDDPKAELQRQAAGAGSAWPHVFGDAIALGKLPAGYQAVQTLDDPHDAALLSRTLASEKPAPDGKPAKSIDDTVDLMGGARARAAKVRDAVRFDPEVKNYVSSIQRSGASADQVSGIVNAVETLALAKRGAGEATDTASAASAAVKSFFGKFDYNAERRRPRAGEGHGGRVGQRAGDARRPGARPHPGAAPLRPGGPAGSAGVPRHDQGGADVDHLAEVRRHLADGLRRPHRARAGRPTRVGAVRPAGARRPWCGGTSAVRRQRRTGRHARPGRVAAPAGISPADRATAEADAANVVPGL